VEDIKNQWQAEFHLMQFRTILRAIRSVDYYASPSFLNPSTVSMIFDTEITPFPIAFATNCVGGQPQKKDMAKLRSRYMEAVLRWSTGWEMKFGVKCKRVIWNPGNCGERLIWCMVGYKAGEYFSLAYSLGANGMVYGCCDQCRQTASILESHQIFVRDLLEHSLLATGPRLFSGDQRWGGRRDLMSLDDIRNNVNGVLVHRG
jgi:hypothetical protein